MFSYPVMLNYNRSAYYPKRDNRGLAGSLLMLHATYDLDMCRPVGKGTLKHRCRAEFGGMEPF
jgi:hypothetical protein